jgi:hypothetical protein
LEDRARQTESRVQFVTAQHRQDTLQRENPKEEGHRITHLRGGRKDERRKECKREEEGRKTGRRRRNGTGSAGREDEGP